jgi:hypothetical protein
MSVSRLWRQELEGLPYKINNKKSKPQKLFEVFMLLIVRMNIHLEKCQVSEDGYNTACYLVCHITDVSC